MGEPTTQIVGTLDYYRHAFNRVGWFIPPYTTMGFLGPLAARINNHVGAFDQRELEYVLSSFYSADNLAAMVSERYPITPHVNDFRHIIGEAVAAHFLGLDHVAVGGLIPAIEGIGKKLADSRSVPFDGIKSVFINLASDCKADAIANKLGAVGEVISMLDSFVDFSSNHLYVKSNTYPLTDNTNRHGISHGVFADEDYGDPINFYKSIAAVDFLCFVSAFRASISWMAPAPTEDSQKLAHYYRVCMGIGKARPLRA